MICSKYPKSECSMVDLKIVLKAKYFFFLFDFCGLYSHSCSISRQFLAAPERQMFMNHETGY